MSFQVASIQNIRKQRQLELELVDLDKRWHVELKGLARERLGLLKELCRINQEMRDVDHFRAGIHGKALSRLTDRAQVRLQQERKFKQSTHKYDFRADQVTERLNLQLPFIFEEAADFRDYDRGDDVVFDIDPKLLTSKELNKQKVLVQKATLEHTLQDKRNRRRAFWDKSIIDARRKKMLPQPDKHGMVRIPPPGPSQGVGAGEPDTNTGNGRGAVFSGAFGQRMEPAQPNGTSGQLPQPHLLPPWRQQEENSHESSEDRSSHQDEDQAAAAGAAPHNEQQPRKPYGPFRYPSLPALNNLRRVDTIRVRGSRRVHASLSSHNSASLDYLPVIKGTQSQHGMFASPSSHQPDPQPPQQQPQQHLPNIGPWLGLPTITEA